jgi:hypothetical protein
LTTDALPDADQLFLPLLIYSLIIPFRTIYNDE